MDGQEQEEPSWERIFRSKYAHHNRRVRKFRQALPQALPHWIINIIGERPRKNFTRPELAEAFIHSIAETPEEAEDYCNRVDREGLDVDHGGDRFCVKRQGDVYISQMKAAPAPKPKT